MRILYIGCVESSKAILEKLIDNDKTITGVVTKETSSFNSDFCDLSYISKQNHIEHIYALKINDEKIVEFIASKKPDIIYCFGWSELIGNEILKIPPLGVVGIHPTKLPQNRGRHPLVWALALGLEETAVSFFMMDDKADSGRIISQEKIAIEYKDDARTLYDKTIDAACRQVIHFTEMFEQGDIHFVENDDRRSNFWRKRGVKDGEIDWRMSSRSIYNLIRALTHPYIGAHFVYKGEHIKVWASEEVITDDYRNIEPGKVMNVDIVNKTIMIKTGDNLIRLKNCVVEGLKEGEYL